MRGRVKHVLQYLLSKYLCVEEDFQSGAYDRCVAILRQKHQDSTKTIVVKIFSHNSVNKKNNLMIALIDHLSGLKPVFTEELSATLNELTTLSRQDNAKVAVRARQVLIAAHQPSYELRHDQMKLIFMSAIDTYGVDFATDNLQKLIFSETSIFDVLQDFFYHRDPVVRKAALEVYIRRAYTSYDLSSLQHIELRSGICVAQYKFLLPSSHPTR